MTDDQRPARGVSAQEFFAAGVDGGSMTAAHHATLVAYSTVHRASRGEPVSLATARKLEKWSRGLGADVFISALLTLDLTDAGNGDEGDEDGVPAGPEVAA